MSRARECEDGRFSAEKMAHWTGVEPVTYRLEIGCSIQLSYRCAVQRGNRPRTLRKSAILVNAGPMSFVIVWVI